MEERVSPPQKPKPKDNNEELPFPPAFRSVYAGDELPFKRNAKVESERDSQAGTYVVQVPKIQIYRVPPPENAIIAERFRNPNQKRRTCSIICTKCFLFFLILILIFAIAAALIYLAIRPQNPTFSVQHVSVKDKQTKHKHHPEYHITLKADNPNNRMTIVYDEGGDTTLSFKKHEIAIGKTPGLHQKSHDSERVQLVLSGLNVKMPSEIGKSMNNKGKNKTKVALSLYMGVPAKMEIGILKLWSMDVAVKCDIVVNTLSRGTRVLHQKCDVKV